MNDQANNLPALPMTTLKPGLLVNLKTQISGGIVRQRQDLATDDPARHTREIVDTTKLDPEELDAATKVRNRASTMIRSLCTKSDFMMCPQDRSSELAQAIAEARELARAFNATSRYSKVRVYVVTGTIAQDDIEATRAIRAEMAGLLAAMQEGVARLDPAAIREAADRAKSIGAMLAPDAAAKVQDAITAARSIARKIIKAGERAASEIDAVTLAKLASARTDFLDLDGSELAPGMPAAEARAVDLEAVASALGMPADEPAENDSAEVSIDPQMQAAAEAGADSTDMGARGGDAAPELPEEPAPAVPPAAPVPAIELD